MAVGAPRGYKQSASHVAKRIAARLATLAAKPTPLSREWLHEQYIVAGRTTYDIAQETGRDPKTIWNWLRRNGIQTRPRGGATSPGSFRRGAASPFTGRRHSKETRATIRAARLRDGRVPYLKNGKHWLHSPGARHPGWKGGISPERAAFYATPEWRAACSGTWARANAKCERCHKDHRAVGNRGTFHVHHIVSFSVRELRAVLSNLALLCAQCHRFVHSRANTAKEFLRQQLPAHEADTCRL